MNPLAKATFDLFLDEVFREAKTAIIRAPILDHDGLFDGLAPDLNGASDWFDLVEPVLYDYLLKVPGAEIEGRAIIVAYGIIEASFYHLENADKAYAAYKRTGEIGEGEYKLLSTRLAVGPQKDLITVDGREYDDWLVLRAAWDGLMTPVADRMKMILKDEDDPDSELVPALAFEELKELAEKWMVIRKESENAEKRFVPRQEKDLHKLKESFDKRMELMQKRSEVLQKRRLEPPGNKDPFDVPGYRTWHKLNRQGTTIQETGMKVVIPVMAERARLAGKKPKAYLKMADAKGSWLSVGKRCGLLLEPEQRSERGEVVYTAPEGDLLLADEVFSEEALSIPDPGINGISRNDLKKWGKGKSIRRSRLMILATLERRYREEKISESAMMSKMGEKYRKDEEPKLYVVGKKTGNLYPAMYIRYIWHLAEYLPKGSKYLKLITRETVMAELRNELPYIHSSIGKKFEHPYRLPRSLKVLCFEDELVMIQPGTERMRPADLHRYLET